MAKEENSHSKINRSKLPLTQQNFPPSSSRLVLLITIYAMLMVAQCQTPPDCLILPNTDKTTPFDGNQCICAITSTSLMHWDSIGSTGCLYNCSAVLNSDKGTDALTCNCNAGFLWNATSALCEADCVNDINSVPGPLALDGTCVCKSKFVFDPIIARCRINCSAIQNIAQQQDPSILDSCSCRSSAYTFNPATVTCDLNCSLVRFAFGPANPNNTCTCNSSFTFNPNTTRCVLNCSQVRNIAPNSKRHTPFACDCARGFLWNSTNASCTLSCRNVENANISASTNTSCACRGGFVWNATSSRCDLNCSMFNNTDSKMPVGMNGLCICLNKLRWDPRLMMCEMNCSSINGSSGTNFNGTSCRCRMGRTWNPNTTSCDLNCSMQAYTSSNASNPNGTCSCQERFYWDTRLQLCVANCSLFTNSSSSSNNDTDPKQCGCLPKFNWKSNETNGKFNSTQIGCFLDCTKDLNSNNTNDPLNKFRCLCKFGYTWDNKTASCQLNCSNMPFSFGRLDSPTQCKCMQGSTWDISTMKCLLNCNFIPNTIGSAVNGICTCKTGYTWDSKTLTCYKK